MMMSKKFKGVMKNNTTICIKNEFVMKVGMPLSSVRNLSLKIIQNTFETTKQFASGILSIFYLFIYFLFHMRMCIDSITITTL